MNKEENSQFEESNKETEESGEKMNAVSVSQNQIALKTAQNFLGEQFSLEKVKKEAQKFGQGIINKAKIAVKIVTDFFGEKSESEIFEEKFGTYDYLLEFYPELINDDVQILQISNAIKANEQIVNNQSIIDLRKISEEISEIIGENKEKELEALENYCIYDFMIRKALPAILKERPDDHLEILDVGGGPSIYQHIPLMGIASSITHSEFLENNRAEITKWREGKSEFDWSSYFGYFRKCLGLNLDAIAIDNLEVQNRFKTMIESDSKINEEYLRSVIKDVIPIDVFQEDLGLHEKDYDLVNVSREGNAEIITSNFCIESATANPDKWKEGVCHTCSRVKKPGGFLLMTAIRNALEYKVGNNKLPAVKVNADDIKKELEKNGFKIVESSEIIGSDQKNVGYDGLVLVLAQKK